MVLAECAQRCIKRVTFAVLAVPPARNAAVLPLDFFRECHPALQTEDCFSVSYQLNFGHAEPVTERYGRQRGTVHTTPGESTG